MNISNPELEQKLTKEEIEAGWHYCHEWDGLLVGPGMEEMECCTCHVDWEKMP